LDVKLSTLKSAGITDDQTILVGALAARLRDLSLVEAAFSVAWGSAAREAYDVAIAKVSTGAERDWLTRQRDRVYIEK
jgi:predicted RNA polymerase sigma factor